MDVVLADDHALVRDALVPFLKRLGPGVSVIEAANFAEALARAMEAQDLRLVILDLYMPGMNGIVGLEQMRRHFPLVPVVILSGSISRHDALAALDHGAAGYLPKTSRGSILLEAVRLVLAGERYIPPFLYVESEAGRAHPADAVPAHARNPLANLSARERDVLALLIDGAPNKVIARQLNLQEVTIKAHLRSVFRKLDVTNRTEAANVATRLGLMR